MNFVFCQETACHFLFLNFILAERVAREPLVVDAAVLVRAQEYFKVADKSGHKFLQSDVLHVVMDGQKILQVLVNRLVFQKCACLHLLLVALAVLA